ncbi:MAG: type VI secretion system tip protein TssI/VgrG [Polyangiaceae bacterium]
MSEKLEFKLVGDALPDDCVVARYEITEALSTLYEGLVIFSTKDTSFKAQPCLRTSMTLEITDHDRGRVRHLSGVVDQCEFLHHDGTHFQFRVRIAPPIAALAHREDCRIYQDVSIVDVVKQILAAAGVEKVDWRLRTDYPKREYIVQYRESELNFVHRLLEDEGIFYFFSHEGGIATMVLSDSTEAIAEELKIPVLFSMSVGEGATDPLEDFELTKTVVTSHVHLRDYDFEKPQNFPQSEQDAPDAFPKSFYEWPGGFVLGQDGQRRVASRLRELRRNAEVARGSSKTCNLEVGKLVTVMGAAQEPLNRRYVISKLVSRGSQALVGGGLGGGASREAGSNRGSNSVENDFEALPEGAMFAPPRTARRPRIHGIQTAMVTGPSMGEEEIHTEKYGRVKVRFRWDRVGQYDDKSSCWLRVMQAPLGGQVIIPRVGWEVAIGFFDGDPDRPYVLGRLYNGERVAPYPLPATKSSGAIKSASSPGGAGMNEIKLGDSGGGQGFNVTAQKDLNTTVGHDQNEKIGVDEATTIKVNAKVSVGANQTISVGGNQEVNTGAVASENVSGDQSITVSGNAVDNAISNFVENVAGNRDYAVGGNKFILCNGVEHTIDGNLDRSVGAVMLDGSIKSISYAIAGNCDETIGIAKIDICKGPWNETVSGNKMAQILAADLHIATGTYSSTSDAAMTTLVGGLHYSKIAGDYSVKAPMITLLGAIGTMKGGGSELKLGGGPIVLKGSKVEFETALLVKLGSSLTMGA